LGIQIAKAMVSPPSDVYFENDHTDHTDHTDHIDHTDHTTLCRGNTTPRDAFHIALPCCRALPTWMAGFLVTRISRRCAP
jgi:hypothetical protein